MIKEEIRLQMRASRRNLTKDEVIKHSDEIYKNLFSLDCISDAHSVCIFLSAFKEPDTNGIIKKLLGEGKKIVVPVTDEGNCTLTLSYIDNTDDLIKGAYGICEPKTVKMADINDIDIVLVPGLAFDRCGGRMGFGKGYYDRLLSESEAVKIGLCYDFQLMDKIPTQMHDVPMDFIITEKEIVEIR